MAITYNEIYRLSEMLARADIPYEWVEVPELNGYRIKLNDNVIATQHDDSCGHEQDKIELLGGLTPLEKEFDRTKGWLSAEDAFKRFSYCYENNTDTYSIKTNHEWFIGKKSHDKAKVIVLLAYKISLYKKNKKWNDSTLVNYIEEWLNKEYKDEEWNCNRE